MAFDSLNTNFGKEKNPSKQEFALDKWQYTPEDLAKFTEKISKGDKKVKLDLENVWQEGGGKAFGLKVCEIIVKNFKSTEIELAVPPWIIKENIDNLEKKEVIDKILRSSDPKEDWLDPESGTLESFDFKENGEFELINIRDYLNIEGSFKGPFILQEKKEGYGLVVDIGRSEILNECITKISSGNERLPRYDSGKEDMIYTSATVDTEPAIGIWNSKDGKSIIPIREFIEDNAFSKDSKLYEPFTKNLFESIKKVGIDFGIQMEIVVHPDNPKKFYLVQIRPSPKKIFNKIISNENKLSEKLKAEKLVFHSSMVNGAFDFYGKFKFFEERRELSIYRHSGQKFIENALDESILNPNKTETLASAMEKIYKKNTQENYISVFSDECISSSHLDDLNAHFTYLGSFLTEKAIVQITSQPIRPNSRHGQIGDQAEKVHDFLDKHCGMLSLSSRELFELQKILSKYKGPIRVVSDGLLAGIYLPTKKD